MRENRKGEKIRFDTALHEKCTGSRCKTQLAHLATVWFACRVVVHIRSCVFVCLACLSLMNSSLGFRAMLLAPSSAAPLHVAKKEYSTSCVIKSASAGVLTSSGFLASLTNYENFKFVQTRYVNAWLKRVEKDGHEILR